MMYGVRDGQFYGLEGNAKPTAIDAGVSVFPPLGCMFLVSEGDIYTCGHKLVVMYSNV